MVWLKALWSRQSTTTDPAACYNECNNAALEAQNTGKVPALCEAGSAFRSALGHCQECCASKGNSNAFNETIAPQFASFINYCNNLDPSVLSSFESQLRSQSSLSSLMTELSITNKTVAQPVGSLIADQTSASAALASLNAQLFTATQNHSSIPTTAKILSTPQAVPAKPTATTTAQSHSNAGVIAPATAVPVIAVAAATSAAILYMRLQRRKRRRTRAATQIAADDVTYEKPQLHSDDLRPELEPTTIPRPQELPLKPDRIELPAVELVGSELDICSRSHEQ